MYYIDCAEIKTHHEIGHVVKRIHNENDNLWVIMCFSSECIVQTADKFELAQPGDVFIKSPDFIEHHYAPPLSQEGFVNDWLHIKSTAIYEKVQKYNIPINRIIKTNRCEFIRPHIHRIIVEKENLRPFYKDVIDNIVDDMLIRIARVYAEQSGNYSHPVSNELLQLRREIRGDLQKNWTVGEMAAKMGLSNSRFSVIYKDRFKISPNEDLILMRIDKAKNLLLSTSLKLNSIATQCGFANEFYFSRIFKEKEKITPGEYRRT